MKIRTNVVMAGVLVCAMLAVTGTARGLSCATNRFTSPEDGARDVPTNTLLWGYGQYDTTPAGRLLGPDGAVPIDERSFPTLSSASSGLEVPVMVPRSELQPNTRYRFVMTGAMSEDDGPPFVTTFTTGAGPARRTPPLPELLSVETDTSTPRDTFSGGLERWLKLDFARHPGILIGDGGHALEVTSADDLLLREQADLEYELAPDARAVPWVTASTTLAVGMSFCMLWPDSHAERVDARFGVLDLAGNFSGWSAATELVLPSQEEAEAAAAAHREAFPESAEQGASCALGRARSSSASLSVWALALGLLAHARRRRSWRSRVEKNRPPRLAPEPWRRSRGG